MRNGLEIWMHKVSCRLPKFKCSKAKINMDANVALESGNKQMKNNHNLPTSPFSGKRKRTEPLVSLAKSKFSHSERKFLRDIEKKGFSW